MAKPGTSTPHDDLFRALLSDRERARAFLRDHLPNEIAGHLQSDPPEIVEGSFIDEALRSTQSDILLEVKTKSNDPAFVYVLAEHKSTPDIGLPLQLAGYMVEIWKRYAGGRAGKLRALPPIIPIVCYHGSANWTVPDGISSMIAGQGSDTLSFLPGESYILRNLSALDVDTLSLDPALKAGFIAMRREALKHLKALAEGLCGNERLQMQVLEYILRTYPDLDFARLQAELRRARYLELEAKVGTIAETLIAEGEARGEARGKRRGLAEGKAISLIQFLERRFGPLPEASKVKIMDASVSELDTWIDGVFDAQSIEALLSDIH